MFWVILIANSTGQETPGEMTGFWRRYAGERINPLIRTVMNALLCSEGSPVGWGTEPALEEVSCWCSAPVLCFWCHRMYSFTPPPFCHGTSQPSLKPLKMCAKLNSFSSKSPVSDVFFQNPLVFRCYSF